MRRADKVRVVIDLKTWRSGGDGPNQTGGGETELLNDEGFRCCLGFASQVLGFKDDFLRGKEAPAWLVSNDDTEAVEKNPMVHMLSNGIVPNTDWTVAAMGLNDNPDLTLDERIGALKEHAEAEDSPFEFVFEGLE